MKKYLTKLHRFFQDGVQLAYTTHPDTPPPTLIRRDPDSITVLLGDKGDDDHGDRCPLRHCLGHVDEKSARRATPIGAVSAKHNRVVVLSSVDDIPGRVADADGCVDFPIILVGYLTGALESWLGTFDGSLR